jgi:uncharacterized protein
MDVIMKLLNRFIRKTAASSIDYQIQPRKVKFEWQDTPIDWIPQQPFASYFINQINLILPAGELWFCRLYNRVLPRIQDEKLKADVQAFIRQEAMHASAHQSANQQYLSVRGIQTERNLAIMQKLFGYVLADQPLGQQLPEQLQPHWDVLRLGIIATVEHMTCVLGNYALYNTRWQSLGADPELLDLIKWHGAEEIEHRTVAFDLYQHLGGSYIARYYLSVVVIAMVLGLWVDGAANIMAQDARFAAKKPSILRPWVWIEWYKTAQKRQSNFTQPALAHSPAVGLPDALV